MNQSGLFANTDTAGVATLAQTLPGAEGRLYNLHPALGGSISTDAAALLRLGYRLAGDAA